MDSISGLRFFFFFFVIDKTDGENEGILPAEFLVPFTLELACLISNFIPGGGNSNSLQYSCLKVFPGQRSLSMDSQRIRHN